jgi:hypothetical protein
VKGLCKKKDLKKLQAPIPPGAEMSKQGSLQEREWKRDSKAAKKLNYKRRQVVR